MLLIFFFLELKKVSFKVCGSFGVFYLLFFYCHRILLSVLYCLSVLIKGYF